MTDIFGDPEVPRRPSELERDAVGGLDRYDWEDFAQVEKEAGFDRSRDMLCDCDVSETGGHLTSDTFFSFLKANAPLRPRQRMSPRYKKNHIVAEEMRKLPEYEALRVWSVGDVVTSASAFQAVEPELETLWDRTSKEEQERAADLERLMEELASAEEGVQDFDKMIEDWSNRPDLSEEDLERWAQQQADAADALAAMRERLAEAGASFEQAATDQVRGGLPGLGRAMGKVASDAQDLATAAQSWGTEPGEIKRMSAAERIALAKRLRGNPKFSRLTDMVGAMTRLAEACQQRKVNYSFEEIYDVRLGSDMTRVLPAELVLLADDDTQWDFYRRYGENKLLEYETRGFDKVARGGIVFAMDCSASMAGEREIWAKAFGLGALNVAKVQDRSFFGIHFSSRSQLKCFDFRDTSKITMEGVLTYAEHFFNGGTDFAAPLDRAVSVLREEFNADGAVKGDIILCTDGQCNVSDEWLAAFKSEQAKIGFKVWVITIGGYRKAEPLWTISDGNVFTITDLLTPGDAASLFSEL